MRSLRRTLHLAAPLLLVLASCGRGAKPPAETAPAPEPAPVVAQPPAELPIRTTEDLVRRMRLRNEGKWYRTLSYFQKNSIPLRSGRPATSEYVVYQSVPGRLRVDFLPLAGKSGFLQLGNRRITFTSGRMVDQRTSVDPIALLGADVYALPADSTLAALDSLGVSRSVLREDSWDGHRAWVIGAAEGDTTSNQLWVDAERFLLLRVIQTNAAGTRRVTSDMRLTYADVDGFPVPAQSVVLRDGREALRSEYTNVRVNVELPDALFDPARWSETQLPVPAMK